MQNMRETNPHQYNIKVKHIGFYYILIWTLPGNIIGKFQYTLFATTDSPTEVDTIEGSRKISGKKINFVATRGVKND